MVQGYFVQKPTLDVTEIVSSYEHLKYVSQHDKRKNGKIANIEKYLQKSHTVFVDSHINEVYEVLKADKKTHFVPVLARDMTPLGIIKDADIKAYIYSNYGKALLYNLTQGSLEKNYLTLWQKHKSHAPHRKNLENLRV